MDARKSPPKQAMRKRQKTTATTPGMRRVIHIAQGFREAKEWEIFQEISLTPAQRQRAAKFLKQRFYGKNPPDVRKAHSRQ
jgi:hypothetical protein